MDKELNIVLKRGDVIDQNVPENPEILEEIAIEELSIDGICGVY